MDFDALARGICFGSLLGSGGGLLLPSMLRRFGHPDAVMVGQALGPWWSLLVALAIVGGVLVPVLLAYVGARWVQRKRVAGARLRHVGLQLIHTDGSEKFETWDEAAQTIEPTWFWQPSSWRRKFSSLPLHQQCVRDSVQHWLLAKRGSLPEQARRNRFELLFVLSLVFILAAAMFAGVVFAPSVDQMAPHRNAPGPIARALMFAMMLGVVPLIALCSEVGAQRLWVRAARRLRRMVTLDAVG